jgi:hypothetical protein
MQDAPPSSRIAPGATIATALDSSPAGTLRTQRSAPSGQHRAKRPARRDVRREPAVPLGDYTRAVRALGRKPGPAGIESFLRDCARLAHELCAARRQRGTAERQSFGGDAGEPGADPRAGQVRGMYDGAGLEASGAGSRPIAS